MITSKILFTCLLFVLGNSVIAQASVSPENLGIVRVDTRNWIATHGAETQMDGLPVMAVLEAKQVPAQLPVELSDQMHTLVPIKTMNKTTYRLRIISLEHPAIQASFALVKKHISLDNGNIYSTLVSPYADENLQFVVAPQEDGTVLVTFTRPVGTSEMEKGSFSLSSIPQLLQK